MIDAAAGDLSSLSSSAVGASSFQSKDGSGSRSGGDSLADAASYLHDLLLVLQKKRNVAVLIAANKADLFTAVPAGVAKATLEHEITAVRQSRATGLLDSATGADDAVNEDWLGEDEKNGSFTFEQLREANVTVDVVAGNVMGADGPGVDGWWDWIAAQM